jgi:putative PEP-CTERM system TPR-repeat lipoprotein
MTILSRGRATALRLLAAGLAAAMLAGCGQPSPEKLMASAKEYLAKGDRSAAVIELKNLLAKSPDNGEARLLLGEALLDAGDYVSAEKELGRALELKQPQEKVVPAYVRTLLAQGKYRAVVTEVEKYKLFNPPAVAATQTAAGDAYMQLGNRLRASEAYKAAMAAVPGYPRARLGEAILVAVEGRIDDALMQVDEVIAADPQLAEARTFRADILLAKGDREGARKALEEAIAANARFVPPRVALIGLLTDDRNFEAAAKLIDSTRKVAPADLRVHYLDASLAYHQGDLERARQQLQQVLKFLPDNAQALTLAGAIELQNKQFTAAENNLRKAVAQAPDYLSARQFLARAYLQMGQPTKAKDTLQAMVERGMVKDPRLQLLAGEIYLANGDLQGAMAFYQEAAKGAGRPETAARTRLGEIALATGRTAEGFKQLEAASELDAVAYQADLALIANHLQRRELEKAMQAVKSLEKKQPENPLTFHMYGVVNVAKQDVQGARTNFERALELQPTYLPAARNLAQLDIMQKRPDDARSRYETMITKEPSNEQIYLALADLEARTGVAPKEVERTILRAVKAVPESPAARLALIDFELRIGDKKAAFTAAQQALAAFPSDPQVLDAVGVAQEAAGEINQAIGTFSRLASLQPQAVKPLYRLAALYVRQGDAERALESLRRVQKIAPRARDVVSYFVQLYVAAGRYEDAFKEARSLQKREPSFAGGYSLEGDIYRAQRKYADAERLYREALKLEPRANGLAIKLDGALRAAGKNAEADAWAKKWIAENPKDTAMRQYLGERELASGNLKVSAQHFQAVVSLEPNNALALNSLAWIGGELGDPKALGYSEQAVKLAPNNAEFLDTYGMLLVKRGETDKALPVLERARKIAPGRNDHRLSYAKALIKAGRKDEARKELEALQGVKENFAGKQEVAGLLKGL